MKLLLLLLAAVALDAQTVRVTIRVVDGITRTGIPDARLRLAKTAPNNSVHFSMDQTTGADGSLTFDAPASVRLWVPEITARGYASSDSSAFIETGRDPVAVTYTLMRTAEISGRIVDGGGRPIEGIVVEPVLLSWLRGRREARHTFHSGRSGEDGTFVVGSLSPGDYALDVNAYSLDGKIRTAKGYPHMVWPGGSDFQSAAPFNVAYGGALNLGEIQLLPRDLTKLTVAVEGGVCSPGQAYEVELREFMSSSWFTRGASRAPCGGVAVFTEVTPGDYEIAVYDPRHPEEKREHAAVQVHVAERDEKVTATVAPPVTIRGTVTVDRDAPLPSGMEVRLWARGSKFTGGVLHVPGFSGDNVRPDGSFECLSYVPAGGEIQAYVPGLPATYFIRELRYAGNTVPGNTFLIHAGAAVHDLTVVLSNRAATLTGTVRTSDGAAVPGAKVLLTPWPADVVSDYPFGVEEAATSASGGYSFTHLRPGMYRVIAVTPAARLKLEEPGAMLALFQSAESFELGEAASSVRQLEPVVR